MANYRPPAPRLQQQDLKGKCALVTGATKGIGRAIALDLATRGCSVLGTYSSPESAHLFDTLSHTVQELYSTPIRIESTDSHRPVDGAPKLKGVAADITDLKSVFALQEELKRCFDLKTESGRIDILVLNATINLRPKVGTAADSDIQNSLVGNLHWPILLVEQLVQSHMFNPNSRVIAISTDRVRDPAPDTAPGTAIFSATKAGLESLARSWAVELPLMFPGTTVNAVSVGLTDTPGLRSFAPEAVEAFKAQRVPKVKVVEGGRLGFAEDVADVVGWLVSEKARWQTGSVVAANGGAEFIGGT